MSEIIGSLVGGIAGGMTADAVQRRRAERLQQVNRLECGIRVVTGTSDGLGEEWRNGVATLSPSRIHFVSYVGGVRFLRRKAVEFQVDTIDVSQRRGPAGREVLWVSPDAQVVRLVTPTATLEWAVMTPQLIWALDRMSGR